MKQKTRKTLRALLCIMLSLVMMIPTVVMPQTVAKADILDENLALGKTVTVSGIEGGYLSDGTLKYPQFVETNLVDGDGSTRWSSGTTLKATSLEDAPDQNEWACVDLGQEYSIGRIVMKWQTANSRDYDVQISSDGETWTGKLDKFGNVVSIRYRKWSNRTLHSYLCPSWYCISIKWQGVSFHFSL